MTDLEPAPRAQVPVELPVRDVDQAIRDQLLAEIGEARLEKLYRHVDPATFNVVLHWLSSYQRRSIETKRGYTDDIVRIAQWLTMVTGDYPAALLARMDFDMVLQWSVYARSRDWSARTQRRYLSALSSLFDHAIRALRLPIVNPVHLPTHAPPIGTSTNGRPPGATRVLEVEEVAAMHAACTSHEDHVVFDLLFTQGLRESEVVALDVEHVDRTSRPPVIHVARKGGRWAKRQLSADTAQHLDAYLDGRTEGPLLISPHTGQRRDRHQLITITRRLARHGGVTDPVKVTPHVLRATAITTLLDASKPLQEVQEWAAHADASTTRGYWERRNSLRRDAALSASLAAKLAEAEAGIPRKPSSR